MKCFKYQRIKDMKPGTIFMYSESMMMKVTCIPDDELNEDIFSKYQNLEDELEILGVDMMTGELFYFSEEDDLGLVINSDILTYLTKVQKKEV